MDAVDLAALDRDGVVAVPGVLGGSAAADLAAACLALAADTDGLGPADKAHGGTVRLDLRGRAPVAEAVAAVVTHPGLTAVVAHLLGTVPEPDQVAFRCPQPGHGEQELHADALPLERVGPAQGATAIVALGDFTDGDGGNGPTVVVPGSHLRPDQQRPHVRARLGRHEVALTGPAGTGFAFSAHLLHRGSRNRSAAPRPALQIVWRRR